ncbi:MAG TPA: LysR substrate-binding domain-containing protein [Myxococcota bacterium]
MRASSPVACSRAAVSSSPHRGISRKGTPTTPHDLVDHDCLRFNFRRSLDDWPFRDGVEGDFTLPIAGPAWANSGVILRALALDGVGIARLSGYHVAADVEAGRLVPVLEAFNPGDLEHIHAVYVGHTHLAARIRAFVDFVAAAMPSSSPTASSAPAQIP